jgi:glutaryl-CoA dehydrogenase
VRPVANDYWQRAEPPRALLPRLAELAVVGGAMRGYGCAGLSAVGAGLVQQELASGDGSLATIVAAHVGLAMATIYHCGSEAQRERWLPAMARFAAVGGWALTEPEVGSDARHLGTRASRDGDGYVLEGAKRWTGNATFADLVVVWAREEGNTVGAFVVEKGTPGFEAKAIEGKPLMRAVPQADITLRGCRVPAENRLANANGFRDAASVLLGGRLGIAWGALGHGLACYEAALTYTKQRQQFGKPLAAFQLVQEKLARMLAELTAMQLLVWRAAKMADADKLTPAMAALAKMNNAAKARHIAADARDLLGGNGILLENHVIRHMLDLEGVFTYEGTDHVNALVVGREITGISAFS